MSCSDNTYRIYCYTHLAAFQLYSWRDQVNMQLTNRVGKTLAHVLVYGLKLKLWQEKEDTMNRVGQICLATVHQRQLLTNVCSLTEAANALSRVMHMQFVIHEALIYVPSYRRVVCLIRPAQRSTDVSFERVIQLSGEHMTPCLYSGVKSHIKQAVRISSEIV